MKIIIETTGELDENLNLGEHREIVHGIYLDFVELFKAADLAPNFIVKLDSSLIESSEHTANWAVDGDDLEIEEED